MDLLILALLAAIATQVLRAREQRARIALLGSYLGRYTIERQMKELVEGYLRWAGEGDTVRSASIRSVLAATEQALVAQFERFATDITGMPAPLAQVSKLPLWIPYAQPMLPARLLFDVRKLMALHARGLAAVLRNERQLDPKAQAFMMTAELMLMQHSCHWYCRSRLVASARMLAQHSTHYAQVLQAISPETAREYRALVEVTD